MPKLTGFSGTVGCIASAGRPLPTVAAVIAILIELLGGFALPVGYHVHVTALVLAVFTLYAGMLFHAFWSAPVDQAFVALLRFFKSIATIGGLLSIVANGAGDWSLDARRN